MRLRLTLTPYLIYLLLIVFALSSCKKTLEEERTNSENKSIENYIKGKKWKYSEVGGVYHVVRTPSYGYQASKGDTAVLWYKGYTLDGKVFDTNIKSEAKKAKLDTLTRSFDPIVTIAGKGNLIDGLDEGILLIRDGEHATILFPSSLGFGGNAMGSIKQWSSLAYDVEVIKVNGEGIENEKSFIEGLNLSANGFTENTSGLYFKYLFLGLDSNPMSNDTIYGWYRGTLPDGTVIEDLGEGNQQIVLSNSDILEGVKLGFMLTKNGGTTDLVLPSYLGYGNQGKSPIEPYQTLFYQIRLDSIKQ